MIDEIAMPHLTHVLFQSLLCYSIPPIPNFRRLSIILLLHRLRLLPTDFNLFLLLILMFLLILLFSMTLTRSYVLLISLLVKEPFVLDLLQLELVLLRLFSQFYLILREGLLLFFLKNSQLFLIFSHFSFDLFL